MWTGLREGALGDGMSVGTSCGPLASSELLGPPCCWTVRRTTSWWSSSSDSRALFSSRSHAEAEVQCDAVRLPGLCGISGHSEASPDHAGAQVGELTSHLERVSGATLASCWSGPSEAPRSTSSRACGGVRVRERNALRVHYWAVQSLAMVMIVLGKDVMSVTT